MRKAEIRELQGLIEERNQSIREMNIRFMDAENQLKLICFCLCLIIGIIFLAIIYIIVGSLTELPELIQEEIVLLVLVSIGHGFMICFLFVMLGDKNDKL